MRAFGLPGYAQFDNDTIFQGPIADALTHVGQIAMLRRIAPLLQRIGADSVERGDGEADIGPLLAAGVPGAGLHVDGTRYFWYHHTDADTPDKLDPADVARCVAMFAVWAYVVADMPAAGGCRRAW